MDTTSSSLHLPKIKFRVLIMGKANAGKTTILQRVCNTTDSPKIYRNDREVFELEVTGERGKHEITDEIIFSNHDGYVFHDSRGLELGRKDELETIKDFVQSRSQEKRLKNRLHAIWYCIPMDTNRPALDLETLKEIFKITRHRKRGLGAFPLPVIAVFTKYEDFCRNVELDIEDNPSLHNVSPEHKESECRRQEKENYWGQLDKEVPFVKLQGMNKLKASCKELISKTMNALSPNVVALMLWAVQRENLELSIEYAVQRMWEDTNSKGVNRNSKGVINTFIRTVHSIPRILSHKIFNDFKEIIHESLYAFPSLWLDLRDDNDLDDLDLDDLDRRFLDRLDDDGDDGRRLFDLLDRRLFDFDDDDGFTLKQFHTSFKDVASAKYHQDLVVIFIFAIVIFDYAAIHALKAPSSHAVQEALALYKLNNIQTKIESLYDALSTKPSQSECMDIILQCRISKSD